MAKRSEYIEHIPTLLDKPEKYTEVPYTCTNENLRNIVSGLDLKTEDCILAIGGSGDQAFAMLEFGARVIAMDTAESQVNFMQDQKQRFQARDFQGFFMSRYGLGFVGNNPSAKYKTIFVKEWRAGRATKYFSEERLERIATHIGNLRIQQMDIVTAAKRFRTWNKAYVSNALSSAYMNRETRTSAISVLVHRLPVNGLLYAAKPYISPESGLPVIEDGNLTREARRGDTHAYNPTVYRKVAE